MIKIVAGEFRTRKLLVPADASISRPYTQRAREAVFNLLREWIEGASVLDLFAGVGSMGLEAVSRGAKSVLLVELDKEIFELLEQNIEALGCGDRAVAMRADAMGITALARAARPVDVVFVDPPYEKMKDETSRSRVLDLIGRCRDVMGGAGFVILRSPIGRDEAKLEVTGFEGPEAHKYGKDMWVLLYAPKAGGNQMQVSD